MNELINVKNENGELLVSARDLHKGLEVKSRFNDWINNRIKKYDFIENIDYTKFLVECNRGQNVYDFILKIDVAKELSMVENNEKGRQIRRYFIECEKKIKETMNQPTLTKKQQLQLSILNGDELERISSLKMYETLVIEEATKPLLDKIEEDKPLVEAYSEFMNSEGLLTTDDTAKIIKIGKNTMLKRLRELNILRTDEYYSSYDGKWKKGSNHNMPYATYMKYFEVKVLPPKNGVSYCKLYIKPEGVDFIKKKVN